MGGMATSWAEQIRLWPGDDPKHAMERARQAVIARWDVDPESVTVEVHEVIPALWAEGDPDRIVVAQGSRA